ncbi:MAG TPA: hypothetical protein VF011_21330 [Terriglobales bacterium]
MEREAAHEWEISRRLAGDTDSARALQQAFKRGGLTAVYELQLDELRKKAASEYVSPLEFASVYASLKHRQEALDYLEEAYREHTPWLVRIQSDPGFDFLHSDPRNQAIVRKVGLPAEQ